MSLREYIMDYVQKFEQMQVKKASWHKVSSLLDFMANSKDEHQYPCKKTERELLKMMQDCNGKCQVFETRGHFGSSEYPEHAAPQYLYFKVKYQK